MVSITQSVKHAFVATLVCFQLVSASSSTNRPRISTPATFGIYLFAEPIEARALARNWGQWKELPLSSAPMISEADILAYDFSKHAMRVRPEALKRLPRPPVMGTPFVVVVNGERIYPGAFYTIVSSITCELPVIVVDRAAAEQSQATGADVLLIERAYPAQIASGEDSRSDVRVKDALGKLKKLASL